MGWSIVLKADRVIAENDVIRALPNDGSWDLSKFPCRQDWGWPSSFTTLGVDVHLPKGRTLTVSGAWHSASSAEQAAKRVASGLQELGYNIKVGVLEG